MLSIPETNMKFCWICGKDVRLEQCITDEHGLSVHNNCHEKRMQLKAGSAQTETWLRGQRKRKAA